METLSLERRLELGPMPVEESTRIMARLAERVSAFHSRGLLHRQLSAAMVSLGASSDEIEVQEPSPDPVLFGGPHWDLEKSPPEFSAIAPVFVPRGLTDAEAVFGTQNLKLAPKQLDLYQLGVLFARLLTGEGASAYLSSPKTKSRVPDHLRPLLDRALGCSREDRHASTADFAQALRSAELPTKVDGDTAPADHEAAADRPIPFSRIGEYEIRGRLGHGGMGDVYKAFDERRNQLVAVKVLPDELARHSDFVRRFYAEAAAAARLQHPHIVEILFVGEDQGRHYFAMEYVTGESLAERLAQQRSQPVGEAVEIVCQILSALEAAHAEGMVHRDIKPGNILLDTARRRAVLADFGLVKSLQETTGLTATGVVVGSVQYISPEQARGKSVDARSDLYSLGVLLYQMVSGELPFTGEGATALIFQHVYEPPRPLIETAPAVSPVLGVIVDKLLAKAPEQRYATAARVTADLQAFVNRQPLPSGADIIEDDDEPGSAGDFDQPLDGTVLIAAPQFDQVPGISMPEESAEQHSLSDGTAWWRSLRAGLWRSVRERAPALAQSLQSTGQQVDGAIAEYERRAHTLQQFTRRALQLLQELRQQRSDWQRTLERSEDPDEQSRCRGTIDELALQISQQLEHLSTMRLQQAKVTATLERLRSQRDVLHARLKVAEAGLRMAGWKRRRSMAVRLGVPVAALSALASIWVALDGPKIWTSVPAINPNEVLSPLALAIPENALEAPRQKLTGPLVSFGPMAFSEDGSKLYVGGMDHHLVQWNLSTGMPLHEQLFKIRTVTIQFEGLAVFPDGVLSWHRHPTLAPQVQFWPLEIDSPPKTFEIDNLLQLLPTSDWKVCFAISYWRTPGQPPTYHNSSLNLYDLEAETPAVHIANLVRGADYCPAASLLVYRTADGVLHLWSLKNRAEVKMFEGSRFSDPLRSDPRGKFAVSTTGKWTAIEKVESGPNGAHTVQIYDLNTGRLHFESGLRGNHVRMLAFQPGTDMLAVASDAEIELWDVAAQRVRKRFQASDVFQIAFSPDGRTLAGSGGTRDKPFTVLWDAVPEPLVASTARELKGIGPATLNADGTRYAKIERAKARGAAATKTELADFVLRSLPDDRELVRIPVSAKVHTLVLSPDDRLAAVSFGSDPDLWSILDLEQKQVRQQFVGSAIQFDSSATVLFRYGRDLKKCDAETGESQVLARGIFFTGSETMAVSPEARWIAVQELDPVVDKSRVVLTNLQNPEDSRQLPMADGRMRCLCFSPDGSQLAAALEDRVMIWELAAGRLVREIPGAAAEELAWSPDGLKLATGKGDRISIRSMNGDRLVDFAIEGKLGSRANSLSFSPDGRYLLCSSILTPSFLLDCTAD